MEKTFIFGACKNGYIVKQLIEMKERILIDGFIDNNDKKQGLKLDGVEVFSFLEFYNLYKNDNESIRIIVALINPERVLDQIREAKMSVNVYILSRLFLSNRYSEDCHIEKMIYKIDNNLHRLDYLECHVAHHCNLRCKGCGHNSNNAPAEFADFEQFEKDLKQLKRYFWGIKRLRLMGGEPLLNMELPRFLKASRELFPDADIRVVTNGLLIPTLSIECLKAMSDNIVGFDISCYPPTTKIKEMIELKCIEYNVEFAISSEKTQFYKQLPYTQAKDPYVAYTSCISAHCHFLLDGKLSLCPSPILGRKYGIVDSEYLFDEDCVDIYTEDLSSEKLFYLMNHPNKLCCYCSPDIEWFDWESESVSFNRD